MTSHDRRPARRLSRSARREQLIDLAMPIVARRGPAGFALDEVASRADVTRNLLYHYFPRGRQDILLAVGERAGRELTDGWVVDESTPLPERLRANFVRFIDHASRPTDAWRIHRHGRASNDPEHQALVKRFEELIILSVSMNNFGTTSPSPTVRLAIKGFIAFSESVLDEARIAPIPHEAVVQMVAQTFLVTLQAAA